MFFLWCCYPGYNNYDVENQLVQVMYDTIPYSSHHPLLHTLFCGGLITLGYKIDDSSLSLGLVLVAWFYCIWKKEKPAILGFLLIILVCSTNLLGPVSDVRYYLILFYLLPICLAVLSAGKS